MTARMVATIGFSAAIVVACTLVWWMLVPSFAWNIVQQYWGHLGPAAFLVAMGVAAIHLRGRLGG